MSIAFPTGQLGTSEVDLFVAGPGTTIITSVIYTNVTGAAVTTNLLLKRNGASTGVKIFPNNYSLPANLFVAFETPLTLFQGDAVRGFAGTVSAVDYAVLGYLEA